MIDTGAEPNIVKSGILSTNTAVDTTGALKITGITNGYVKTLGSTEISIYGKTATFQVVSDDFPIPMDGILGAAFLNDGAEISYVKQVVLWKGTELPFVNKKLTGIKTIAEIVSRQELNSCVTTSDKRVDKDHRPTVRCVSATRKHESMTHEPLVRPEPSSSDDENKNKNNPLISSRKKVRHEPLIRSCSCTRENEDKPSQSPSTSSSPKISSSQNKVKSTQTKIKLSFNKWLFMYDSLHKGLFSMINQLSRDNKIQIVSHKPLWNDSLDIHNVNTEIARGFLRVNIKGIRFKRNQTPPFNDKRLQKGQPSNEPQQLKMNPTSGMVLLALLFGIAPAHALIGYDCGGRTLNVTTLSAVDPIDCEPVDAEPATQSTNIQLLQLGDYNSAPVIQCKVEIDRSIYYCGMHSHTSVVQNGRQQYIFQTSREACRTLHATGSIAISSSVQISGVGRNSSVTFSLTLAGTITMDGSCTGTSYADPFGSWDNVVVQGLVKITVQSYPATVKLSTGQIILKSGYQCRLQEEVCLDPEAGHTYWDSIPKDYCEFSKYNVLYEGKATKIIPHGSNGPLLYTVMADATTFALATTHNSTVCGYTLVKTEHPKLLILETDKNGKLPRTQPTSVENLDIFTYVNSKFIYVEKHIRTQLSQLYKDVVMQRCHLERQVIQNALALIHVAPEEMALAITKQPGHMAISAGEVIHIIKCIPVSCRLRRTKHCHNELPVTYKNSSYFLTPKTRILTSAGTRKDCSSLIPTMYKIHNSWYRITPRVVEAIPPQRMQSITQPTWKYVDPANLATGGIYSPEDITRLRDHIMFPIEKTAVINTLVQGVTGRQYAQGNVQLSHLLDEASINRIAESAARKFWNGFITFGSVTSGVIGLYVAVQAIRLIITTILNGIALHAAYGWSMRLVAALWSSMSYFCIFLKKRKEELNTGGRECLPQKSDNAPSTPLSEIHIPISERTPTRPLVERSPRPRLLFPVTRDEP
ncbi:uncharacterized protein LOC143308190 [Osmia lignaria lignaria]|uniref:uncharacterized protein LOC143308190 n=1 Tax=Osmia lignaria lignaria TaxID=1437193 RepID=UPI00402BD0E5